jgi:uncharacterized protein YbjT (DUF2867 family)
MTTGTERPSEPSRRIAVIGGTGLLGRHVVEAVTAVGHLPIVVARSRGVDITTGEGLDAALTGADALIDVSNITTLNRQASVAFFTSATANLLAAGHRVGIRHHVALSIVGVERVLSGYYEGKRQQEKLVLADANGTVLRATQFFEFADQLIDRQVGPVVLVPAMRTQAVAAREVAAALVEVAAGPVLGLAPELAGPEQLEMVRMVRQVVKTRGRRRLVIGLHLPGRVTTAMAGGALLPTRPGPRGRLTFAEWLQDSDRSTRMLGSPPGN